jgi:co-chaperonin GroES (HSP10)
MKVVNKRLLVKPDPVNLKSEGGIVIPDRHADAPSSGTIIASSNPEFPEGTHIHYFAYSAKNWNEFVLVPEAEVLILD